MGESTSPPPPPSTEERRKAREERIAKRTEQPPATGTPVGQTRGERGAAILAAHAPPPPPAEPPATQPPPVEALPVVKSTPTGETTLNVALSPEQAFYQEAYRKNIEGLQGAVADPTKNPFMEGALNQVQQAARASAAARGMESSSGGLREENLASQQFLGAQFQRNIENLGQALSGGGDFLTGAQKTILGGAEIGQRGFKDKADIELGKGQLALGERKLTSDEKALFKGLDLQTTDRIQNVLRDDGLSDEAKTQALLPILGPEKTAAAIAGQKEAKEKKTRENITILEGEPTVVESVDQLPTGSQNFDPTTRNKSTAFLLANPDKISDWIAVADPGTIQSLYTWMKKPKKEELYKQIYGESPYEAKDPGSKAGRGSLRPGAQEKLDSIHMLWSGIQAKAEGQEI